MATWSVSVEKMALAASSKLVAVVQEATWKTFKDIAIFSPVDTGLFSGNWVCTAGEPATDKRYTLDKSRALALAEAAKAKTFPIGGVVYFSNNLPYAMRLEHGWSGQAPLGMVRLAADDFPERIDNAIEDL